MQQLDNKQEHWVIIQSIGIYLECDSRAKIDVTRNLQAVKFDNAGD
jgi:hypothetical protein